MNKRRLSTEFYSFLNNLSSEPISSDWRFIEKTTRAFGSPGGSWSGTDGFLFRNFQTNSQFIIRSIDDKDYLVMESLQLQSQLYNINLDSTATHINSNGKSQILESFVMTIGQQGKKKVTDVKAAFKFFNKDTNVIAEVEDNEPDWTSFLIAILEWSMIREKVKLYLKNNKSESVIITNNNEIQVKDTRKSDVPTFPLNQILYGPPGTGKTYNAIPRALKIINDKFELKNTYSETEWENLKAEFDNYRKTGQIEFITFHQSTCYEDFVEGIKPLNPKENEGLQYDVVPGIFKRICDSASGGKEISFEKAYELFIEELSIKGQIELKTPTSKSPFIVKKNNVGNCSAIPKTDIATPMTITRDTIRRYLDDSAEQYWRSYAKPIFDYITEKYYSFDNKSHVKNFVLIIDEINRGNVSAIFGELITLLEPAKRIGGAEHLKIKLPYSKADFEVPANLFIIGTMNTADRSVEALDTALRRRFSFVEMPPQPKLIAEKTEDGIELRKILTTINSRIEILLDKDHLIGHSYLIKVQSASELKVVFHNSIIPLLQEYFYGDYGKIGLVLGEGFFEKPIDSQKSSFSKFYDYDSAGLEERQIYKLRNVEKMNIEDFIDAINTLLK